MKTSDKIIVIDLEATCWQDTVPPGQENEIIEIGLAVLDSKTGEITQNQGILIKPQRSNVSSFCTELTTITQDLLDTNGVSFAEAIKKIVDEYQQVELFTWASYGQYDLDMMKRQCESFGVSYPMGDEHINVKTLFSDQFGLKKTKGMKGALNLLNISLEGTHHRGVDDAKNTAKILHWCLQN